jgi:hypothetical protein
VAVLHLLFLLLAKAPYSCSASPPGLSTSASSLRLLLVPRLVDLGEFRSEMLASLLSAARLPPAEARSFAPPSRDGFAFIQDGGIIPGDKAFSNIYNEPTLPLYATLDAQTHTLPLRGRDDPGSARSRPFRVESRRYSSPVAEATHGAWGAPMRRGQQRRKAGTWILRPRWWHGGHRV